MPAPGRRGDWPQRLRLGRPGAARARSHWLCQVRPRRPRTPCASSAGGANRVLPELLTPSVAPRIASPRSSSPVLGRSRPPFAGLRTSSVPGPVPPPAGLGQNVDRGPRAPLVGLPSGLSAGRGCARSLCSSGAHPSHPCHGQGPSRRRPPAGALLSARPPDRWAPRGARQSRRTRCISPTCAKNRPTPRAPDPNRSTPSVSRRRRETRLTALLPLRPASLTALARASERPAQLAPDTCSFVGTRVARCPYRRLLREAASSAPRGRRFWPLRGRARLPLTPLSHPAAS